MADNDVTMEVSLEGTVYRMAMGDFTGEDDLAVWRKVGVTIGEIFGGRMSLFTIAALLWRWRVTHGEPDVTYEQVNSKITMNDLVIEDEEVEGGETPEG